MGVLEETVKDPVTIENILDGILWNVQWIACNPLKEYKGKTLLFMYHFLTEIILMVLVCVDVLGRTLSMADFALTVMYFTVLAQTTMKLIGMYINKDRFRKIIKTIKIDFWKADKFEECTEDFNKAFRLVNAAFNFYKFFFAGALLMHLIVPVYYREMIIYVWTPFEKEKLETSLPHLLIPAVLETFTFGYTVWFSVIYSDCLFGLLLSASILQFKLLQHGIKSMGKLEDDIEKKKRLTVNYVKYHRMLFEFIVDVEYIFKYPIICQLMCAVFAICVSAFLFTDESTDLTNKLTFLSYVCCNVFEMLLYCVACQAVHTESLLVAEAVYFSGWENYYDQQAWLQTQFMIFRSQRDTKMTAFLVDLNLELFLQVIQLSFSIFTLLQNTIN